MVIIIHSKVLLTVEKINFALIQDENIKLKRELSKLKAATVSKPCLRLRNSIDEGYDHGITLETQAQLSYIA